MQVPSSLEFEAAWQKCEDLWLAAGATTPCYEENYMKARAELAVIHEARRKWTKAAILKAAL